MSATLRFTPFSPETVRAVRGGAPDAYGNAPERAVSDGAGVPCRHCLRAIPAGAPYLILAARPFRTVQPYAETGPIFLCAEPCAPAQPSADLPEILDAPDHVLRGYDASERIVYGSGAVVPTADIPDRAAALFEDPRIAFAHVRSARNTCFLVRIDRAEDDESRIGRSLGVVNLP